MSTMASTTNVYVKGTYTLDDVIFRIGVGIYINDTTPRYISMTVSGGVEHTLCPLDANIVAMSVALCVTADIGSVEIFSDDAVCVRRLTTLRMQLQENSEHIQDTELNNEEWIPVENRTVTYNEMLKFCSNIVRQKFTCEHSLTISLIDNTISLSGSEIATRLAYESIMGIYKEPETITFSLSLCNNIANSINTNNNTNKIRSVLSGYEYDEILQSIQVSKKRSSAMLDFDTVFYDDSSEEYLALDGWIKLFVACFRCNSMILLSCDTSENIPLIENLGITSKYNFGITICRICANPEDYPHNFQDTLCRHSNAIKALSIPSNNFKYLETYVCAEKIANTSLPIISTKNCLRYIYITDITKISEGHCTAVSIDTDKCEPLQSLKLGFL